MARLDLTWARLDALTIGLYAAIGMTKSLGRAFRYCTRYSSDVLRQRWFGAVRDVLLGTPVAMLRVGSLYALAAAAGRSRH